MHNYRNMKIYSRSLDLTTEIYRLTRKLPRDEAFGLTGQIRRAAISVCLNIAEGSGASSNREFGRFLDIARRSLYETKACLDIAFRLELLTDSDCSQAISEVDQLAAMITGFRSQLQRKIVSSLGACVLAVAGLCSVLCVL